MKRTKGTTPPVQPGLFDSADVYSLADANTKLQAQVARLTHELAAKERDYQRLLDQYNTLMLMALNDPKHPKYRENTDLKRQVAELDRLLSFWIQKAAAGVPAGPRPLDKGALTKLLTLAHPDRWAQGQPATALAHELSVAINAMRKGAQA